ncbi:hypothetical protein B0I37DRAFT_422131 [Chaetomium sp. MPI-CAGE-AT-0009]|nr:hypothetical protein B0I37DRAFT_422131 [Chaetomium sp. MPI-CAGE-AT-0009]
MATFHLFPLLPFELRALIWELTVEPRTVKVGVVYRNAIGAASTLPKSGQPATVPHVCSPTRVPPTLQVCREARGLRLYQQAFSEISPAGTAERRLYYVWLNLEIDRVFVEATTRLESLEPVAPLIKRLKAMLYFQEVADDHLKFGGLAAFVNAREIDIICLDGVRAWWYAREAVPWPCENVIFIDWDCRGLRASS